MQTRPVHILVIDDDPPVLDFLCEALREFGYSVAGAAGGREGMARILADAPDLVVLDLRMPDMSGQQVLTRMRAVAPTVPVVVVTVIDDLAVAERMLAAGALKYLTKPVDLDVLAAAVADALSHRQRP